MCDFKPYTVSQIIVKTFRATDKTFFSAKKSAVRYITYDDDLLSDSYAQIMADMISFNLIFYNHLNLSFLELLPGIPLYSS